MEIGKWNYVNYKTTLSNIARLFIRNRRPAIQTLIRQWFQTSFE